MTNLFNSAPDLLEDFKQFLPESAAQAKQQPPPGRPSIDEPAPTSNTRGEPYPGATAQTHTPGRDVKMPPLGQFNVKDSGKESKKRRGGPGAATTVVTDSARMGDYANRAGSVQAGSLNKVSRLSRL